MQFLWDAVCVPVFYNVSGVMLEIESKSYVIICVWTFLEILGQYYTSFLEKLQDLTQQIERLHIMCALFVGGLLAHGVSWPRCIFSFTKTGVMIVSNVFLIIFRFRPLLSFKKSGRPVMCLNSNFFTLSIKTLLCFRAENCFGCFDNVFTIWCWPIFDGASCPIWPIYF